MSRYTKEWDLSGSWNLDSTGWSFIFWLNERYYNYMIEFVQIPLIWSLLATSKSLTIFLNS